MNMQKKLPRPAQKLKRPKTGMITGNFEHDYEELQRLFANSSDFSYHTIRTKANKRVAVLHYTDLIQQQILSNNVVRPLQEYEGPLSMHIIQEHVINVCNCSSEKVLDKMGAPLAHGAVALLLEGIAEVLMVRLEQFTDRGIERSQSEDVIIGPHVSFGEDLGKNVAFLRRYLRTSRLKVKRQELGRLSHTGVSIVYLEGVAQQDLVKEAERRLARIDIDYVPGAAYLIEFLEDHPLSILPQLKLTERPDRVVGALSEGRIAIMADGDPTCLVAPFFLPEALQSSEDYYEKPLAATFFRLLRLVSSALSIFLPGFWVTLVSFHHGIIPPKLFSSIVAGRENVPLPTVIEAILLLFAFDIVIEASTRLPSAVGQAIGIVGAIILGQSAVQASLISPSMTIIVALAGLAVYINPSPGTVGSIRILKYFIIIISSLLGLFGTVWGLIFLTILATSTRSFGYPSLFPVAPFNIRGCLDIFVKVPNPLLKHRPHFLAAENEERMQADLPPALGKDEADAK